MIHNDTTHRLNQSATKAGLVLTLSIGQNYQMKRQEDPQKLLQLILRGTMTVHQIVSWAFDPIVTDANLMVGLEEMARDHQNHPLGTMNGLTKFHWHLS